MAEDDAKSTKTTATAKTTKTQKPANPEAEEEEAAKPVQEEEGGWKEFVWNSEKREFLGRTGKSWLDITIFYIIFFISLYCFFMLSWYMSLLLVDTKKPFQTGKGSILYDKGPGFTFRPVPDRITNGISTLIWFTPGSYNEDGFWTDQLKLWFENIPPLGYEGVQKCVDGEDKDKDAGKFACAVYRKVYGECNGLNDPKFGYSRAEPCILLKLNRIYGWKPNPFSQDELEKKEVKVDDKAIKVPKGLQEYIKPDFRVTHLHIWCEGENEHDKENLGSIEYYPGPYFELRYFPFMNQKNYQSPFVMLKLKRPLPGALISIVCRTFAKNSFPDRETGVGYARFQVLIGS